MNDFTKDELRMIAACVLPSPKEYFMWTDAQKSLHDKVMTMIDNYCEHENTNETFHCDNCKVAEYKCNNCAAIFYEGI